MVTTTATSTGTSAVQTATKSLLTSLGTGSGVDTTTLVDSLVQAQFAARTAQLTAKAEKLTAQISGISSIKSAVTGFATALDTLAKGGTLQTQPKSSTTGVLSATALPNAALSGLSSTVAVNRLAGAQAVASAKVTIPNANGDPVAAGRSTVLGSGSFTVELGTATYAADGKSITDFASSASTSSGGLSVNRVSFDLTDATVDTIAAAINAKAGSLGITASVVTGTDGSAYLSLKGATGAAKAFTLAVDGADSANLKQFEVGENAPTRITAAAQNAELTVDGVTVERATNTIGDLVAGVRLDLTAVGSTTLTATKPTAALAQAVEDVVETYNQVVAVLQEQTDAKTGKLFGDPAAASLLRRLKGMTLAAINPNPAGAPATLAELGVRTARDGTLSVDQTRLTNALATYPDAVEAMFKPSTTSTTGLAAMLQSIAAAATSTTTGLGASTKGYTDAQTGVTTAQAKVTTDSETMTTRLTAQFAAMNTRVTAYKSVQSFLTNQIAAWNKSDG